MLLSETLFPHLREIDEAARSRAAAIEEREIAKKSFSRSWSTPKPKTVRKKSKIVFSKRFRNRMSIFPI
jgi:hypothetical protein